MSITAVLASCLPLITMPARYATGNAASSALVRAAVKLVSWSAPPANSLSVTNSSALIAPAVSAFSPYCTPTLSRVSLAKAVPATLPQTDSAQLQALQRAPLGLVVGSYTALGGSWQLLVAVGDWLIRPVALSETKRWK